MKQRILILTFLLTAFFTVSWAIIPPVEWNGNYYATIQSAIDAADAGGTINIAAGTYVERLTISKSITLNGADKATVIINTSTLTGSSISIQANSVTIQNLTVIGNTTANTANWGIKAVGLTANTTAYDGTGTGSTANVVHNVHVQDCYMSGIDFNGVWSGSITDVTVEGSVNARGIGISDCRYITISGVTAQNNYEAHIGVTARGQYYPGGCDHITLGGGNTFTGNLGDFYTEIDVAGQTITNVDLSASGLAYEALQSGRTTYAYFTTLAKAVAVVTDASSPFKTLAAIKDISANSFYVQGGMAIQPAINAASSGATITVAAGTYNETVTIDKNLSFAAVPGASRPAPDLYEPALIIQHLTINNTDGFTLTSPVKVTGNLTFTLGKLFTSESNFIEIGSAGNVFGETDAKKIVGDVHTRRMLNGAATPVTEDFGGIGCEITVSENLGLTTIIRRTGSVGLIGRTINRVWLLYGNVTPTIDGTITLSWLAGEDNGIAANGQVNTSLAGDPSGSGWTPMGSVFNVSASERSVTFTSRNGGYYTVNGVATHAGIKAFLQGPYSSGSMSTALAAASRIPLAQPYTAAPYSYAGTELVPNTAFFTTNTVTDWVMVELRSTATGAAVDRRAALLKSNGTIIDTDGSEGVNFNTAAYGDYYIVIRHRNHLAIMSAAAVTLPNVSGAYDFTTAQAQAYGTNAMQDLTGSGPFAMWMGDANGDGVVKYNLSNNDKLLIYNRVGNAGYNATVSGYYNEDLNLDGVVKYNLSNNDKLLIYNVIGNAGYNSTKSTQVPN